MKPRKRLDIEIDEFEIHVVQQIACRFYSDAQLQTQVGYLSSAIESQISGREYYEESVDLLNTLLNKGVG